MQRREGKVDFLGEQSGLVDDTLKRELILEFATRPDIRRAYLAKVKSESPNEPSAALCLVSKRPDDKSIVIRIGEILRRRFDADVPMDVLFLTAEEESDLARTCAPFYVSPFP